MKPQTYKIIYDVRNISDWFVRIVITFTTLLVLFYFADVYNNLIFDLWGFVFLGVFILKSCIDIFWRKE